MQRTSLVCSSFLLAALSACGPDPQSCFGPIERLEPVGAIEPTAQWGLGTKAGPYVFVSGMRGIAPATNEIVLDHRARVRQAYTNMFFIAAAGGAQPEDLIETVVYVRTDAPHPSPEFFDIRRLDNEVRQEFYGEGPYPNRTFVGLTELNGTDANGEVDVFEVKGTFYVPCD
ncbi:MAG: RidA family protein [Gammaproteobacteria bacterium]|nr:RidA family protein [Gammaproteobacteria bacterium]